MTKWSQVKSIFVSVETNEVYKDDFRLTGIGSDVSPGHPFR